MAVTVTPNLTALDPSLADSATGWAGVQLVLLNKR